MTHESDLTYLGRTVYTTWTFLWFLHHAWSVDKFRALRWKRIKRFELKSAITLLLMIMCPLQILYDVLCSVIKYEEGFIGSSFSPPFQIYTKPYEDWSPEHKSWVGPIDYVLCANFSVQTGLLFLLQSFWNYLANNLTNTTFMGSFEFKSYIVYSIFSAITFPFLQYTFRGDPLRMELVPQVVYGVFQIIVAALGIRSDSRFKRLLAKNAASAQPHVYQKLEYFKDMNRILTGALLIASTSLIVISVDGLTAAQFLSRKKWVADFLITNVSFGLYMVFLSLLLIFYPSKNFASDTASVGKNSSFSKRSINQVSESEKWGNNKNAQFNAKPESSDSSFYVDMGEDSIYNASAAPSVHNFKAPPSLSQFARSDSLDGATCVQISPISPVSPMSQFSTPPLFSPSTSSLQSPRSPPPHANTYPPLTPIQTAHTYNHSRAMESDVIRPNAMNPPPLFSPIPLKATTPSGSEFSFSRKNSVSSSEAPLIASRENSLGSIEISASTAPPTPRKSPNRPPSISTPVIKITRSSRESLKDDEVATVSLAQKLNIRKSTAVVAPIIPSIEEEEPPIKGYVGSGAGIPPKTKPQSPTAKPQSPTAKPQSPQHRKRSSSSSLLTKNAQFRGATVAMNQPQTPPPGTQRKRSSSNVSLTTRNAIIRGASAPSLRSQNNTTKRSSLKSTSSSVSSSNTISGTSIKGSPVSTTTSRTAKRSSPPTSTYSKMTRVQNSSSPVISTTRTNIRANSTRTTQPPLKKESSFTKQRPPPLFSSSSSKAKDGMDLYVSPASTPGSGDIGVAW